MEKIFYNGKIITMTEDDAGNIIEPEAILIRDGIIKKIGSLNSMEENLKNGAEGIDLQGKCLMPAFIDSHSHMIMSGEVSLFVNLSDCYSFEDIVNTLKEYVKINDISSDKAVIGFGYDHNFLNEQDHPDRFVLDRISLNMPVIIIHISGHLACINSMALKLAGINEKTENPTGGFIGRFQGSKEPNGYLEEAGLSLIQPIMARFPMDIYSIMETMQNIYIENGIATVQDGAATEEDIKILKMMAEAGKLYVDVVAYPLITANGAEIIKNYKEITNKYKNRLKIGGYKIILDGSPQGKSAWLSEPYEGEGEEYCGYATYDNEIVEKYIMQTLDEETQILAHCNGDAASEQFLSIYEKCLALNSKQSDLRPVMIHCQTVRKDQLKRMAKLHMLASVFIGHVWYWGDIHLRNLGQDRGNHISPVKDAIDEGVLVTFHQDTPVTKPDMLHSVWCAVNRISREGNLIGQDQRIGVYEALKAVTINAAYQYFEEETKGSIEKGKKADLVILSESPLDINSEKIKDIKVLETIKDGITIYKYKTETKN